MENIGKYWENGKQKWKFIPDIPQTNIIILQV
jgi:hypothetical protein